jgi:hypothetical protein
MVRDIQVSEGFAIKKGIEVCLVLYKHFVYLIYIRKSSWKSGGQYSVQPVGPAQGQYPQPYAYRPTAPPRKKFVLTGGVALVIILLAIGLSSCGALMIINPDYNRYAEYATQDYNGSLNIHQLLVLLKNESFAPGNITANETGRPVIVFHPFCGLNGTADANKSKMVMNPYLNKITIIGNKTEVKVGTAPYNKGTHSQKDLEDQLKCVLKKVQTIFETQLGLKLTKETMKYQMEGPGFEAIAAVATVVSVSFIVRRNQRARKK